MSATRSRPVSPAPASIACARARARARRATNFVNFRAGGARADRASNRTKVTKVTRPPLRREKLSNLSTSREGESYSDTSGQAALPRRGGRFCDFWRAALRAWMGAAKEPLRRCGAVAQMGERCNRTAEVRGSIPLSSTNPPAPPPTSVPLRHRPAVFVRPRPALGRNGCVPPFVSLAGSEGRSLPAVPRTQRRQYGLRPL
jgi:hypothetical protein